MKESKRPQKNFKIRDKKDFPAEKPIPPCYPALDNDLARDNLENDIPAADLQEL